MGHRHPADFEPVAPPSRATTDRAAFDRATLDGVTRDRSTLDGVTLDRAARGVAAEADDAPFARTARLSNSSTDRDSHSSTDHDSYSSADRDSNPTTDRGADSAAASGESAARPAKFDRRAHALSFAGLFLFTFVLYFRPYELFPALSGVTSMAFWVAVPTLAVFFATQLSREGNLTARPREVNIAFLFVLAALLSIPLALDRGEAWDEFNTTFVKAVLMFVVMVNAVRTERRLRALLWLTLAVSCYLSVGAINDFGAGRLVGVGERVVGAIGGMFGNPNDMALHLVTVVPVAVALFFTSRNPFSKLVYAACAALVVAGIVVTFSRGGFLGLTAACGVLAWKLGRRHKLLIGSCILAGALGFVLLAPGNYASRLGTIADTSADATGSAGQRRDLLLRSLLVTARHPLFGVGMGNFHTVSIHELVSHNAYTQVSAEMGVAALALYVWFMVAPLRRLRAVERETFSSRRASRFYYLAVGLQASLVGYMVSSFFASVAYNYYVYYLVGYAVCLRRLYEAARAEGGELTAEETQARAAATAAAAAAELDGAADSPDSRDARAAQTYA